LIDKQAWSLGTSAVIARQLVFDQSGCLRNPIQLLPDCRIFVKPEVFDRPPGPAPERRIPVWWTAEGESGPRPVFATARLRCLRAGLVAVFV
jgi:hypothetical protein